MSDVTIFANELNVVIVSHGEVFVFDVEDSTFRCVDDGDIGYVKSHWLDVAAGHLQLSSRWWSRL